MAAGSDQLKRHVILAEQSLLINWHLLIAAMLTLKTYEPPQRI